MWGEAESRGEYQQKFWLRSNFATKQPRNRDSCQQHDNLKTLVAAINRASFTHEVTKARTSGLSQLSVASTALHDSELDSFRLGDDAGWLEAASPAFFLQQQTPQSTDNPRNSEAHSSLGDYCHLPSQLVLLVIDRGSFHLLRRSTWHPHPHPRRCYSTTALHYLQLTCI